MPEVSLRHLTPLARLAEFGRPEIVLRHSCFETMMQSLVMKFGGTSVGDLDRIARAARLVRAEHRPDIGLAIVVSAMSGETNKLVGLARNAAGPDLHGSDFDDEYDVVCASGEQVTSGLLALALRRLGLRARSWQSWQIPIQTNDAFGSARITGIEAAPLMAALAQGEIAIIPGFQGLAPGHRVTTLGRGGSDTSAVAVAAAIGARQCDIYTDVDGVYTTDPRLVSKARRLDRIAYEEMLEMASLGAKVLQTRSVELAMNWRVPVRVLSSFVEPGEPNPGTLVCDEDVAMEQRAVTGIAYSRDEAKIILFGLDDRPGVAADVFGRLADANINVDMIVQSEARTENRQNLLFTLAEKDVRQALSAIEHMRAKVNYEDVSANINVAKVSVVGVGMRSHTGVARTMFQALASKGINIQAIATSEIKISVLVDSEYTELAVRALHSAFHLDQTEAER